MSDDKKGEATEPQEEKPNAVVVHRVVTEDGIIDTVVQILGDVKPTEVQTILELGVQKFRSTVGLGQSGR